MKATESIEKKFVPAKNDNSSVPKIEICSTLTYPKINLAHNIKVLFSALVLLYEHRRFTGQQQKGGGHPNFSLPLPSALKS